jgi:EAL domain-containing protein (putative c-di-GMP-specific phosphodiesterase class I)
MTEWPKWSKKILLEAMVKPGYVMHGQPIVQIRNNVIRCTGWEMLIRLEHDGKLYPPVAFMDAVLANGLDPEVGAWVIRDCLTTHKRLLVQDLIGPHTVSINVSKDQFRDPELSDIIHGIISSVGINPLFVHIEINETSILQDEFAQQQVRRLQDFGMIATLDDFGMGGTSMQVLANLGVEKVKLDASYTQAVTTRRGGLNATAMITHAYRFNIDVVAEGVETMEQCRILMDAGCDTFQGWLFAKAMPVTELVEFANVRNRRMPDDGK